MQPLITRGTHPRTVWAFSIRTGLFCALLPLTAAEPLPAPLFDSIGHHHHPVATTSEPAQRYFDQGLMLLFNFNHREAIRSFRAAQQLDPQCTMAYWGEALAYGPQVNSPMDPADLPAALSALARARELSARGPARERALVEALATRYPEEPVEDRSPWDLAYAEAMRTVSAAYPDDHDTATLFAEALMDTMPWNYWQKDGTPKPATVEVIAVLRHVLARHPHHPGANHLLIHAVEAGPEPELAEPAADRLLTLAPARGHLTHMPSHIYLRVGRYADAARSNELAIAADERYLSSCLAQGFYPGVYYPHNVHFLWQAQLLMGRSAAALDTARKVAAYASSPLCGTLVFEAPRFRHLPLVTWARFGRWSEVLAEPAPPDAPEYVIDRAARHYARALAFIAHGDAAAAKVERSLFDAEANSEAAAAAENPYFPAALVLQVAGHLIAGKIAGLEGDHAAMITQLEQAVCTQDRMPYMEPPFWFYSARQTLGAALLAVGRPREAEGVFRADLRVFPRNGWGLFGLATALGAQQRADEAKRVWAEFDRAWAEADTKLDLAWF